MFKNEIGKHKKLKCNGTFEFIDQGKNCDKQNILNLSKKSMIYVSVDGWRFAITIQNLDNKNFGMF